MLDSADKYRMEVARQALSEVLSAVRLKGCPVVVFCNKRDLPGALSMDEINPLFKFDNRDVLLIGGSGKTGSNVQEAFAWLITRMEENSYGGMAGGDF